MCGLVGVAGDLDLKDVRIFKELLMIDTFRGIHSTGIARLDARKDEEPEIVKQCVPGWEFFDAVRGAESLCTATAHILIGHNRHATAGAINKHNAHPFYVADKIVGVHNGTLDKFETKRFIDDMGDFGTDSEAALHSMAVRGEKETLENIVGAWAFVWYNYETNQLNFTRNSQRPLHIAINKKTRKCIYWASELDMLKFVLRRNGQTSDDIHYYYVQENTVLSIEMPATLTGKIPKWSSYSYEEKKAASVYYGGRDAGMWASYYEDDNRPFAGSRNRRSTTTTNSLRNGGRVSGKTTAGSGTDTVKLLEYKDLKKIQEVLWPEWFDPATDEWIHTNDMGEVLATEDEIKNFLLETDCSMCGAKIDTAERWRALPRRVFVCESCAESEGMASLLHENGVRA